MIRKFLFCTECEKFTTVYDYPARGFRICIVCGALYDYTIQNCGKVITAEKPKERK